ncbi:MAG: S8 family serine peptidase [Acidobacteria bacterium]|nr:S8 family serine peptidase [Acidobacteriota bacterium]MYJ02835.1 S8 family serine peptidase [Acidobacteriota bacterium]
MMVSTRSSEFSVGVIDSGIHAGHPHVGALVEGAGFSRDGMTHEDVVDRLGHGTAVAAAIQDLAPAVQVCPLKVFDRTLDTSVEALVAAIERAASLALPLVNLSLGTTDGSCAAALAAAVRRANAAGAIVVAAGSDRSVDWLPGTLGLEGVLRVELDWSYPRGTYAVAGPPDAPVFLTCGYPRSIPGVDPERNLKGLSFAVANMTGTAAGLMMETGVRDFSALVETLRRRTG